jgi:hypothetical protein
MGTAVGNRVAPETWATRKKVRLRKDGFRQCSSCVMQVRCAPPHNLWIFNTNVKLYAETYTIAKDNGLFTTGCPHQGPVFVTVRVEHASTQADECRGKVSGQARWFFPAWIDWTQVCASHDPATGVFTVHDMLTDQLLRSRHMLYPNEGILMLTWRETEAPDDKVALCGTWWWCPHPWILRGAICSAC